MSEKSVLVIEEACPPELLAEVRELSPHPTVVSSLAQARQRLATSDYDLVLCGVHLPDGNWADVIGCLVRNGREADFFLCVSHDDARLRTGIAGPWRRRSAAAAVRAHGAQREEAQLERGRSNMTARAVSPLNAKPGAVKGRVMILTADADQAAVVRAVAEGVGIQVVAVCSDPRDAPRLAREMRPDLLLSAIFFDAEPAGIEVARQVQKISASRWSTWARPRTRF